MPSRLLDYLPAIYQTDPFIGEFLLAFEKVLLGREDDVAFCYKDGTLVGRDRLEEQPDICYQGLEQTIAQLATLFDPQNTPEEFLSWLAGWTALSLRSDLQLQSQRDFIAKIVQRYRFRGTKANLQELLKILLIVAPEVEETDLPHFFEVNVQLPPLSTPEELRELGRQIDIARSIIELEKPAHTDYQINPVVRTMQISQFSTVGVDTLLGTIPTEE